MSVAPENLDKKPYESTGRRARLNELIDKHGKEMIIRLTGYRPETLKSYRYNSNRDISKNALDLLELKIKEEISKKPSS